MDSTWMRRDLPVLEAAVRLREELGPIGATLDQISADTGLSGHDVEKACSALEGEYIAVSKTMGPSGHWRVNQVSAEARRVVGQWPTPEALTDRIVAALNQAAEDELDEAKKGKLKTAASVIGGVARDLVIGVASGAIAKSAGT